MQPGDKIVIEAINSQWHGYEGIIEEQTGTELFKVYIPARDIYVILRKDRLKLA